MKTEAETEVTDLPAEECQGSLAAMESQGAWSRVCLRVFGRNRPSLPTPCLWTCDLQNWERRYFCWVKVPHFQFLVMTTLGQESIPQG